MKIFTLTIVACLLFEPAMASNVPKGLSSPKVIVTGTTNGHIVPIVPESRRKRFKKYKSQGIVPKKEKQK